MIWVISANFIDVNPTIELIKTLELCNENNDVKVFIADNKSSSKSRHELEKIKKKSKLDIELFYFKKNYFYWPAISKILNNLKFKKIKFPSWIIVCNNDIKIKDVNFFKKLRSIDKKKYSVIGPQIINKKKVDLNPFLIEPMSNNSILYWKIYFISYWSSVLINYIKKFTRIFNPKREIKYSYPIQVYAVHGSFIIFSNTFFNKGGYFDINFSMYGEELSTAEISKRIGCKIFYNPNLSVFHNEHSSTKKIKNKKLFNLARKSHFHFVKTYLKN